MSKKHKQTKPEEQLEAESTPDVETVIEEQEVPESAPAREEDPIETLNAEIEELQKQLTQSKNDLMRAYADTDNTRKRLLRETEQVKKYRFQNAALELLPILDNLDLALASKPENEEAANFVKGFEMIRTQLVNALQNEGVKEIEALDKPFDANFMQALMTESVPDTEPGKVVQVLQKGYMLKDRMLRPALVKVSE